METLSKTVIKTTGFRLGLPAPLSIDMDKNLSEKLYEYLLLISPHGFLNSQIVKEKKYFFENYKNIAAIYGKPHITLANFLMQDSREEEVVSQLKISLKMQIKFGLY